MDGARMDGTELGRVEPTPPLRGAPGAGGGRRGAARADASARGTAPDEPTPMMRQYIEIRAANPDCLLFYRMGDFYELFFDDAVEAARALGIHLTKRGKHLGEDIPMCGVPVATADDYLQKLIALGYRVAVCEQLEDPSEAKKRGAKSVVRRDVVRLVTPGTITEDALLDPSASCALVALARVRSSGEDAFALASIDISTGAFRVAAVPAERLGAAIAAAAPAELIVPEGVWADPALRPLLDGAGAPVQPQDASCFDADAAPERLARALGVATLEGFGDFTRAEFAAMAGAVGYVETTQKGERPALRAPERERPDGHMLIDAATRASLEIERGPEGGRKGSLLHVMDRTLTGGGARLLAARLRAPLTDRAAIEARLEAVAWMLAHDGARDALRGHLRGLPDMERAVSRLALGRGRPMDLVAVRDALRVARAVAGVLRGETPPGAVAAALDDLAAAPPRLADRLDDLLAEEVPARVADGGLIRPGAISALDEARTLATDSRAMLAELQARYAAETGVRTLRLKHNNVLGHFVEVNAAHAAPLQAEGSGFRHRQTLASAMRFATDELEALEARINGAAEEALGIERDMAQEMTAAIVGQAAPLRQAADGLAALDVAAALARLAEGEGYARPEITDGLDFQLTAARHPVVEQALRTRSEPPFVANDADLSPPRGAARGAIRLLTGPNMGGKSTYLRQCALIAVMAQAGSFVPAGAARIGVVDRLFSRVGASDDLARGRSTFMVEMVETATILNQATARSLVVLDEIGRGTATHDGLSIAWAAIEHLHEAIGPRALFATHFHELTALEGRLDRLSCIHCRVEEAAGEVVFLHTVAHGAADRSYGVQVARLAGLPGHVVARAGEVLARLEGHGATGAASVHAAAALDELPLFSALRPTAAPATTAPSDPLREAVEALCPDEMTPREAMDALYRLRGLLDG